MFMNTLQEDEITDTVERLPAGRALLDIVERASLFALLQQAMQHRRQELPSRLYDDLNVPPSQRPDFTPRCY